MESNEKLELSCKLHDTVQIEWIDSWGMTQMWEDQDDYKTKHGTMRTVGFFVKQTKTWLYLAQSVSSHQYGRIIRVPVGCVTKMWVVA